MTAPLIQLGPGAADSNPLIDLGLFDAESQVISFTWELCDDSSISLKTRCWRLLSSAILFTPLQARSVCLVSLQGYYLSFLH